MKYLFAIFIQMLLCYYEQGLKTVLGKLAAQISRLLTVMAEHTAPTTLNMMLETLRRVGCCPKILLMSVMKKQSCIIGDEIMEDTIIIVWNGWEPLSSIMLWILSSKKYLSFLPFAVSNFNLKPDETKFWMLYWKILSDSVNINMELMPLFFFLVLCVWVTLLAILLISIKLWYNYQSILDFRNLCQLLPHYSTHLGGKAQVTY